MNPTKVIHACRVCLATADKSLTMWFAFVALLIGTITAQAQPAAAAPTPSLAALKVLSLYNSSGTYSDHTITTWYADWYNPAPHTFADYTIPTTTSTVKGYQGLGAAGVEFIPNPIDASPYDTLHIDVYTPNADQFAIKLVSNAGEYEYNNTPAGGLIIPNTWVSLAIPLTSFPGVQLSTLKQIGLVDLAGGGVQNGDFYVDNVYFSSPTNVVTPLPTANVGVKAATMVNPYLTDTTLNAPANGGGLPSLNASYAGSVLTFAPSTYGNIIGDDYVADLYDTDPDLLNKHVVFSGHCNANTLAVGYTAVAWIKDFDSGWSVASSATTPLVGGADFTVSLDTGGTGHHIQWGIEEAGTAVADNTGLGNVQIYAQPAAIHVALTGQAQADWIGSMNAFDLNTNYLATWWGNNTWGIPVAKIFPASNAVSGVVTVNMNPYYDNANNADVYDQITGNPKIINDAAYLIGDDSLLGAEVIFSGYCWSNTLSGPRPATAFVKEFNSSWSVVGSASVPLVTDAPFSVDYVTLGGAGHHLQYGLELMGQPERRLPVDQVGTHGTVTVGSAPSPKSVRYDSAAGWAGAMNVFSLGGGYIFSSGWGIPDLKANLMNGAVTLSPNTSIDRDVPLDTPFWWLDGSGTSAGNRNMEGNLYVEDNGLGGHPVTFSGSCLENTLVAPYTSVAFVQEFDSSWNVVGQTTSNLVSGLPFSVDLTTTAEAGHHIRYGFKTYGPNARQAGAASLGHAVVINFPIPTFATASLPDSTLFGAYNQTISMSGSETFTYAVASGTLPVGLSLASNGTLSGKTIGVGTNAFTVTATHANSGLTFSSPAYTVRVPASTTVDTNAPTVKILTPANSSTVISGLITGTAKDIGTGVAGVLCQLNGGALVAATGSTNWTYSSPAYMGTNVIVAYSVDRRGNVSAKATNTFVLNTFSPLTLTINGSGTVVPASITNGSSLQVGKKYMLTFTPNLNNLFSNVISSATGVANSSVYSFTMTSNLTLTVNFITNRFTAVAGTYNGLFNAVGTITNEAPVVVSGAANVYISAANLTDGFMNVFDLPADGGGYQFSSGWGVADLPAAFSGNVLTLSPNVNTYNAADSYWVKPSGAGNKNCEANISKTDNSLAGQTVAFSGICDANTLVSPYTSVAFIKEFDGGWGFVGQVNANLVTGQPFTVTKATGAGNHVQYGFQTTGPDANPATVTALGHVVVRPAVLNTTIGEVIAEQSSGLISVMTSSKQTWSGKLYVQGTNSGLVGKFDLTGASTATNGDYVVSLHLDFVNKLTGTVSNSVAGWISAIDADLAPTNTALTGKYTMLLPGFAAAANGPIGDGFVTLNVTAANKVTAVGNTAEGVACKVQAVKLSASGRMPLYAPQSSTAHSGLVVGWVQITNNTAGSTITGDVSWIKTSAAGGTYYAGGFTNLSVTAPGSVFVPGGLLSASSYTATYSSGEFAGTKTDNLSVAGGLTITPVNAGPVGKKYTFVPGTGLLKVTKSTNNPAIIMNQIKGCYLQSQNYIGGYFLGTSQAGQLLVQ